MQTVTCHITLKGRPLCEFLGTVGGRQYIEKLAEAAGISTPLCGYESIAEAKRVVRKLQTQVYGLKIVRGECPAS